METVTETSNTTTALVLVENKDATKFTLPAPVFILFAEYLGYETPFIKWCENMCTQKNVPEYQKNIIISEAKNMLVDISKEYSVKKIHDYFEELYDVAIDKWLVKYNETNSTNFNIVL